MAHQPQRRTKPMRFEIRFKIGNRFGAASRYTLVEISVHIVDRHSLTETELATIVTLQVGETFTNEDMQIRRVV